MKLKEFFVSLTTEFDDKQFAKFDKAIGDARSNLKSMGLAVAGASAAIFGLTKSASSHSRTLMQNSRELGLNVERLQELQYAAKVTAGVSEGELQGALHSLTGTIHQFRMGNIQAGDAITQLGIPLSMLNSENMRADQLFAIVSDRISKIQDPLRKAALANEIFGGSGAALIPLLDKGSKGIAAMGSEARKYGNFLSASAVREGEAFDKSLTRVAETMKGIINIVGIGLIKAFKPALKQFQEFVAVNRKVIASKLAEYVESLVLFMKTLTSVIGFLADRVRFIANIFGGFENVVKALAVGLAIVFSAKLVASITAIVGAMKPFMLMIRALGGGDFLKGSAWVALFLILEDFQKFMMGGKSVTEDLINAFDDMVNKAKESFPELTKIVTGAMSVILLPINAVISAVRGIAAFAGTLAGGGGIGEALSAGGGDALSSIKEGFSNLTNFVDGDGSFSLGKVLGLSGARQGAGSTSNSTQNNAINNQINVSVPQGTTTDQAINIVGKGIERAVDAAGLRQARDSFVGGAVR